MRVAATFGGVLILALLAGLLTEATLTLGPQGRISNDIILRPVTTATPTPTPTPTATPIPTPVATATPVPTVAATPVVQMATTSSFVRLRAGNSTNTAVLAELSGGVKVQVLPVSDSQWQQVQYNGMTGYIFKAYLIY